MSHFADVLLERIAEKGAPICIGFDPVLERLPTEIRRAHPDALDAFIAFAEQTFPIFAAHAPCIKIQSACFERYGYPGVGVYEMLTHRARQLGLIVIGDAKRGDIGISAEHYAMAMLIDPPPIEDDQTAAPDAVTVNSYFGADGLLPFTDLAAARGKGVFALVRTSNPGGDAIQSLRLADGRTVAEAVAGLIAGIGDDPKYIGASGYSLLGAVVGATKPGDAARLRALMPRQLFLVPGFGAQGGSADDVRACFKPDGTGAIITASRSVIFAYAGSDRADWHKRIDAAALQLRKDVIAAIG